MVSVATLFQNHRLYPEFVQVKSRLMAHQFVCWIAGGAVRDLLLERDCDDFDLVTDASTETLKILFPEALLVGEKFGVLKLILKDGNYFDLTTFRQESDYQDGRRPSSVSASTPLNDALRRDFTVNAIFWDDENKTLRDYVGGLADLRRGRLTAVGLATTRFREDYLRILRLVRFAAQLHFDIDAATVTAAREQVTSVMQVSGERVWAELKKIKDAAAWNFALRIDIFHLVLQQIFGISVPRDFRLKVGRRDKDASAHLFFILSGLLDDTVELKNKMAQKLHLSKEEQSRFDLFLRARQKLRTLEPAKLALEIEKKPLLESVLQYFVFQDAFESDKFKSAVEIIKLYPQPLMSGEDLKDKVELRLIGIVLNEVRVQQFSGLIHSRDQALDYIKNNFATSV